MAAMTMKSLVHSLRLCSIFFENNIYRNINDSNKICTIFRNLQYNMVMCFVQGCKHYSEGKTCKFFVFPVNPAERRKWINLIRRKDREPSKHSLVCSCHFIDMDRKNRPTIFEFNSKRKLNFENPEKRKRTVKKTDVETSLLSTLDAITTSSEPPGLSELTETEPPGTSRSEYANVEELPSCSRSAIRTSGASFEIVNYFLKKELEEVTEKLKKATTHFSYEQIKNNDAHILMYTGIPTNALFLTVHETMESFTLNYYAKWQVQYLPRIDQMLMSLMKLRLNLPHEDLAIRFSCSSATVTNIVMTWIYALHEVFYNQLMKTIPSRRKNQLAFLQLFSTSKTVE